MTICSNWPEGLNPKSHIYGHVLTSCFLDTILVPLCTWLYLLILLILYLTGTKSQSVSHEGNGEAKGHPPPRKRRKLLLTISIIYYLLLLAQMLMCSLEIARLSLAKLGIGLLPFTYITLILAFAFRFKKGLDSRVRGWVWANVAVFGLLAVANGIKLAQEVKEGVESRKGTKYPEVDQITDVAVMIGVYAVLGMLEVGLHFGGVESSS